MKQPLSLTAMMYHYVRDPGDLAEAGSGIGGMSVAAFEAQLDELARQHTFVTWHDVRMALQEDRPLPDSPCLLTFDDGIIDHYVNVFRVLRARGLSGLFFILDRAQTRGLVIGHRIHFLMARLGVVAFREAVWEHLDEEGRERFSRAEAGYERIYPDTSPNAKTERFKAVIQRELSEDLDQTLRALFERHIGSEEEIARSYYLSREQILEMAACGMHFGGHSRSHPWLDWIQPAARAAEIRASAEWIRQFESGPWAFAYPYGGLSKDLPHLLQQAGFLAAFTTRTGLQHPHPYYIGRLDGEELNADA
jgi:peptidoglycan/xylan/chitin deacetylase (PgdA/CDA1 family)